MKQTISVTYYKCPVCGKNSTSKQEIERHFRQHQIKADEVAARAFFLSKGAFGYVKINENEVKQE